MPNELVSIGMPVYNGERYLEAAICSNLEQTHRNLELVISDNCSTDGTEDICRRFAKADDRVRYTRNSKNIGAAGNYNRVFALSRGQYFRWSNADDLAAPELIERTLPVLQSRLDVVIAYGGTCLIDADGRRIREYDDRLDLQYETAGERYRECVRRLGLTNVIYGLMRRNAMERTELMGNGTLPAADVSFIGAMALQGKFVQVPGVLFHRRMHKFAFSADAHPDKVRQFWRASGKPVRFPRWHAHTADARAIIRAPLAVREKAGLLAFQLRRMFWDRRSLARDVVNLLRRQARS